MSVEHILRQRAFQLAQETQYQEPEGKKIDVVVFTLNNEQYAVETQRLKAIRPVKQITPLPRLPQFVKGVTPFFGIIYTVIDFKALLGIESQPAENQHLLIIEHDRLKVCFLVDQILQFRSIPESEIDEKVTGLRGIKADYLSGLSKDAVVILNLTNILNDLKINV